MAEDKKVSLEQLAILEDVLDERKTKADRRKKTMVLPPEIERRSGRDRRDTDD